MARWSSRSIPSQGSPCARLSSPSASHHGCMDNGPGRSDRTIDVEEMREGMDAIDLGWVSLRSREWIAEAALRMRLQRELTPQTGRSQQKQPVSTGGRGARTPWTAKGKATPRAPSQDPLCLQRSLAERCIS